MVNMKTLRYNTTDQTYTSHTGQYLTADKQPGRIDPPQVQLEVIETEKPQPSELQKLLPVTYTISINPEPHNLYGINGTATEVYTLIDKTESELIAEAEAKAEAIDNNIEPKMLKEHLRKLMVFETDEDLLAAMELFPAWKPGMPVVADEVYQHNENLYKVIQSHTTQLDWPPEIVPALFLQVAPPGVIPEWVQPTGGHDSYNIGDEVMFEGQHYVSLINGNTWSPTAYPAGWQLVT
jgi:hypothetical protein